MKNKKTLVVAIIIALFLTLTINVFATDSKNETLADYFAGKTNTTNTSASKNDTTNTVENKVDSKETTKEEKAEVKEEAKEEVKTEIEDEKEELVEDVEKTYDNVISNDLYKSDKDNILLENTKVNGNVFVVASDDITIKDFEVNGDVFLFSQKVTIENTVVNGNIFIASKTIIIDVTANSVYVAGENVTLTKDSVIANDFRGAANSITLSGIVGRNTYTESKNIIIKETAKLNNAYIGSEQKDISKKADIDNMEYKTIDASRNENDNKKTTPIAKYWIGKSVELVIILLIASVIVLGLPKFVEVNNQLSIKNFFVTFFTGILEMILAVLIVAAIFITGHGIGYGIALMGLVGILIGLGEVLFIISLAIRIVRNPDKASRFSILIMTAIVTLAAQAIGMLSLLGFVGFIIVLILKVLVAISGFGATIKVVFTSNRKLNKLTNKNKETKQAKIQEKLAEKEARKEAKLAEKEAKREEKMVSKMKQSEEAPEETLHEEIKNEVKEEINELKEEQNEEKNIEEKKVKEIKEVKEEVKKEDILEDNSQEEKTQKEISKTKKTNNKTKKDN